MFDLDDSKYSVVISSKFKKDFKKVVKQGKDINKLKVVVEKLLYGEELESKYKDHALSDNKYFKNYRECHITPDWLLVYKYNNDDLILFLIETGSHSELFGK